MFSLLVAVTAASGVEVLLPLLVVLSYYTVMSAAKSVHCTY